MFAFKKIFTFTFLFIILLSCHRVQKITDIEKKVFLEIIPPIVDSIAKDIRIFNSPPPNLGKFIETKDGGYNLDTSLVTLKQKKEFKIWQRKTDSLQEDTAKLFLAFDPIIKYDIELEKEFKIHFIDAKILKLNKDALKPYQLTIDSIPLKNKFRFRKLSDFPLKFYNIWSTKFDFNFSGIVDVSRIVFDETRNYGVLSAYYLCGDRCGQGYIIYIRKVNNKWIIDKIVDRWIA